MWRWRAIIGVAAVIQVAAGLAFFALSADREAAPFGLALCAGIGVLTAASLATGALIRVAIGANIGLALLMLLGGVPVVIALVMGAAPSWLTSNAIGAVALAAASAGSAVGLQRLSSQSAKHA